jgi:hypothetical protein
VAYDGLCGEVPEFSKSSFLNCRLDDGTLLPTIGRPFDLLTEGLISKNTRDNKTAIELFLPGSSSLGRPAQIAMRQQVSVMHSRSFPRSSPETVPPFG